MAIRAEGAPLPGRGQGGRLDNHTAYSQYCVSFRTRTHCHTTYLDLPAQAAIVGPPFPLVRSVTDAWPPPRLLPPARLPLTCRCFFFFNDTATTEIYTLSLHDALPI